MNGGFCGGVEGEAEVVGESDGAQHTQVVFLEAFDGIANCGDQFFLQISFSVHKVVKLFFDGVVEHAVDGKVTTQGIFFGSTE